MAAPSISQIVWASDVTYRRDPTSKAATGWLGGVNPEPPYVEDMNGVLNNLSDWLRWVKDEKTKDIANTADVVGIGATSATAINIGRTGITTTLLGDVVIPNTFALTNPTISSFVNATHDHSSNAKGGALLTNPTITDYTNATHTHLDDATGGYIATGGGSFPTDPTITDFTNANHTHADAANGGAVTLPTAPTFTDFTNANHTHADAANGGTVTVAFPTDPTITDYTNATHTHTDDASGGVLSGGGSVADPLSLKGFYKSSPLTSRLNALQTKNEAESNLRAYQDTAFSKLTWPINAAINYIESIVWCPNIGIGLIGSYSHIHYTRDGITTAVCSYNVAPDAGRFYTGCYSPELQCAIMIHENGDVYRSTDGIAFVKYAGALTGSYRDVCYAPELGLFIATNTDIGAGKIATSVNGTTWTVRLTVTNIFTDICWAKELGLLIAVASNSTLYRSVNGVDWTTYTTTYQINKIAWSGELGQFVGVANAGSFAYSTSTDGISWTAFNSPSLVNVQNVTWANGLGVFAATGSNFIKYSTNGLYWQEGASVSNPSTLGTWCPELGCVLFVSTIVGVQTLGHTNVDKYIKGKLWVQDHAINIKTSITPTSASATGTKGDIQWDSSYIYICVDTNQWHRASHATW